MEESSPCLLCLDSHARQRGDEGDLPGDVCLVDSLHLSFPNHVQRWSCSIWLLRYLTCSIATLSANSPVALRLAMSLG